MMGGRKKKKGKPKSLAKEPSDLTLVLLKFDWFTSYAIHSLAGQHHSFKGPAFSKSPSSDPD